MPNELPHGWVRTTLGEICVPVSTIQPVEMPNANFTYFDIGGIDNRTNRVVDKKTFIGRNAPSRARQAIKKGDILFSTVRTYLRKIARVEDDEPNAVASTGFAVIRPAKGVSSEFLFFQVLSEEFLQAVNALQSGSSYPAVRAKDVFSQPILLPPTLEQERIASKLIAAMSAVQQAEAATNRARDRVERYRMAVLNSAVTGELTRSWRAQGNNSHLETGDELLERILAKHREAWEDREFQRLTKSDRQPKDADWRSRYPQPRKPQTAGLHQLPESWTWASPMQLASPDRNALAIGPFGSNLKVSDYKNSGVPLIFVRNIRTQVFSGEDTRFVSLTKAQELSSHQVRAGDILVTKMGDPPGDACLYPEGSPAAIITADCIRFQLSPLLESTARFLVHSLNSTIGRDQIRRLTKGVAQQKITLSLFTTIALPLPSLTEQAEIVREIDRRLLSADRLANSLQDQQKRAVFMYRTLLRDAMSGQLVPQNPTDEPAPTLLSQIRASRDEAKRKKRPLRQVGETTNENRGSAMPVEFLSSEVLLDAWQRTGKSTDARRLFDEAGLVPEQAVQFYEVLRTIPEIRTAFQDLKESVSEPQKLSSSSKEGQPLPSGRFRLVELWLEDFKNLKDYIIRFNPGQGLDVVLGWNGTGKSNLFEALVIVFRDLHDWTERNRWPDKPMSGFRLRYEIDERIIEILWQPGQMRRPELKTATLPSDDTVDVVFASLKREDLALPRFIFGYYSGPTNRLAEHFLPMKQAHYERLRLAKADDAKTLARLLEKRRFFCAETHHAKYVLLGFSYKEDVRINEFLERRLRIVGFESALFIIRKPHWAKSGSKPGDFWGATGIMRRVMERLRRFAIAPMVLEQRVNYGYRSTNEDHYYFFLPDLGSLHAFAAEYQDARSFFLALESTDFSELIHDVKIQVRIRSANAESVPITFHQLSEGEQQLLMVLGLIRFTKSHQSLLLLDEPDTHLNPHWSVEYLKDLTRVMSDSGDESIEQQTSQILMATHDPLVIASLVKEQIHLLRRDPQTDVCRSDTANVNPRGLGFTGILTSEMFGFRSDLDPETLADLDDRVRLIAREESLDPLEKKELEEIDKRLAHAGFSKAFSDPYYAAFVRAWGRQYSEAMAGEQFMTPERKQQIDQIAAEVLREAVAEVEKASDN
jgi:restriction endonuclease S subunit/predicted ATPase